MEKISEKDRKRLRSPAKLQTEIAHSAVKGKPGLLSIRQKNISCFGKR